MKGFGKALENICAYTEAAFNCYELDDFASITVEPVPTILDTPGDLCNAEFLKAANKHATYHRNKNRIEREGRA